LLETAVPEKELGAVCRHTPVLVGPRGTRHFSRACKEMTGPTPKPKERGPEPKKDAD
jgi:hypothetical protein